MNYRWVYHPVQGYWKLVDCSTSPETVIGQTAWVKSFLGVLAMRRAAQGWEVHPFSSDERAKAWIEEGAR